MKGKLNHELLIILLSILGFDSHNHRVLIDSLVEFKAFVEVLLRHKQA